MDAGVGTPLAETILAGALSGKGSAVFVSDSKPGKQVSSSGGPDNQADQVELSATARARLKNDQPEAVNLQQGRGELAAQDIQDQLKQVDEKLSQLRELVREAPPARRQETIDEIEAVANSLDLISRQIKEKSSPEPVQPDLSETAKSFKDLVDEFQARFKNEERIPPSLYNQIRHLLEKSLADDAPGGPQNHVDALA